ncbi:MAG: RidA family protein [Deltaproteobacteria bacterium]|nr:RidA family protein [Deltaproteobacteria bacterium]
MSRQSIQSPAAPAAIGPYSQAIRCGNLVFCSGQIPLDPVTGELLKGTLEQEVGRVMRNLEAVLGAAGSRLAQVVRTTIYLTDLADFAAVNAAYATFFEGTPPARTTIQVAGLPKGARVEIDAIAAVE